MGSAGPRSSKLPPNASATWGTVGRLLSMAVSSPGSAEPARDVILGELVLRAGEQAASRPLLDHIARPVLGHVEEHGPVRGAGGLLHVVGHDHDGVLLLELEHELLDLERRARIE